MKSYRVVLLGKSSVGKTSIVLRLINNKFEEFVSSTIGGAFHTFEPPKYNGNVKLEIWDTAGQERYRSLAPMYYRNSSIVLIIYDIVDKDSFNIAKGWVKEIKEKETNKPIVAFIGNKIDLMNQRTVSINEANSYAKSQNIFYYEISALSGHGIQSMFNDLTRKVISKPCLELVKSSNDIAFDEYAKEYACC